MYVAWASSAFAVRREPRRATREPARISTCYCSCLSRCTYNPSHLLIASSYAVVCVACYGYSIAYHKGRLRLFLSISSSNARGQCIHIGKMSGTGDLPIDIVHPNIDLSFAKTELPLQITPSSAPRIRSIDVGFPGYGAPAVLANVVVKSFPALETLCARLREPQYYEKDYSDPEEEAQEPIVTVKTLEIQHAPLLARVVLENCLLPWNANVYSHLELTSFLLLLTSCHLHNSPFPKHCSAPCRPRRRCRNGCTLSCRGA
jgi:hypothetical protein